MSGPAYTTSGVTPQEMAALQAQQVQGTPQQAYSTYAHQQAVPQGGVPQQVQPPDPGQYPQQQQPGPPPQQGPSSGLQTAGQIRAGLGVLNTLGKSTGLSKQSIGDSGTTYGDAGKGALDAVNIYTGLTKGGLPGYTGAAVSGADLANKFGANIPYVGPAGQALGIVNGIRQGGLGGYTSAAANAAALYGTASDAIVAGGGSALAGSGVAGSLAPALGPIMMAYGLKAFGDNQTAHMNDYNVTDPVTGQHIRGNNPMMYDSLLSVNGKSGIQTLEDQKHLTDNMTPTELRQYQNQQNKDSGMGTGHARGGSMSLRDIYTGSYADRTPHFDDGGYVDYVQNTNNYSNYDPTDYADPFPGGYDPGAGDMGNSRNVQNTLQSYLDNPSGDTGGLAALTKALSSGGKDISSVLGSLKGYAPLLPLIASLTGAGKTHAPGLPSQYTGQTMNIPTPSYSRVQNPALANKPASYWLHAGESAQPQFYMNNALPATAASAPNQQAPAPAAAPASGAPATNSSALGLINALGIGSRRMLHSAHGGPIHGGDPYGNPYDSPSHSYIRGPGDGTSDDVNAKLSNGEYVVDAPTVSLLGNGSNEAGAKALDGFRHRVRTHAGKKLARGKQPMHAATPDDYFTGAAS